MRWIYKVPLRLRSLFRRKRVEQELSEELQFHLEKQIEENVAGGMAPEEARYAALREFGCVEQLKEECRDSWGVRMISELGQDIRYGLRQLRRNPGFTAAATITLGLGIGCATAIFSAFNATVLHPLPYPSAQNVVRIEANAVPTGHAWTDLSLPDTLALRRQSTVFDSLGYYGSRQPVNLTGTSLYAHITTFSVSPEVFKVLGIRPVLGRWLRRGEAQPGNDQVMVISHSLWAQSFGANPDVIGKTVRLDNKPYRVVGVMPAQFAFPDPFVQAWLPEVVTPQATTDHMPYGTPVIARLKRGVSPGQAQAELDMLARRLASENPMTDKSLKLKLIRLEDEVSTSVSRMFWVLLGAVGLVLLIACANVGNLFLARNAARERELAVRISLGSGRARMAKLVMVEALLLSLTGGCLGFGFSVWGLDGLRALASGSVWRLANAHVDVWVLGFALAASVATGILFGLVPALCATRLDLNACLRGDLSSRPVARAGRRASPQNILASGQIALVLVLLVGAVLMQRTLSNLMNVPLGFDPYQLVGAYFALPASRDPSDASLLAFQRQVLDQVRAIPGVRSAALGSSMPLMSPKNTLFLTEQPNKGWARSPVMEENSVGPGYFQVLGMSLIRGRPFLPTDSFGHPCVAILNEAGARAVWGNQNPLGRMIDLHVISSGHGYCQIVGEVSDARFSKLDEPPGPEVYFSRLQKPEWQPVLMVRTAGNPLALVNVILDRIASIPGAQRVMFVYSIDQLIERSALQPRFRAMLLSLFACLTLAIAAIGIYGVMAYFVSQRTREIGIRMALGAQRVGVLTMVVGQGLRLAMIGVAIGIAGALVLTRFLSSLLYGVKPTDPLTFVTVSVILIAVALVACYVPARRAAKVDPMVALRYE